MNFQTAPYLAGAALVFVLGATNLGPALVKYGAIALFVGAVIAAVVFLSLPYLIKVDGAPAAVRKCPEPEAHSLQDLYNLTPTDFEIKVGMMLTRAGFTNVNREGGSGDLQADLTARTPKGRRAIIQCKRYRPDRNVTSGQIQSFIGMAYTHHDACVAIYVTTGSYTGPARDLAREHGIILIEGRHLRNGLRDNMQNANLYA